MHDKLRLERDVVVRIKDEPFLMAGQLLVHGMVSSHPVDKASEGRMPASNKLSLEHNGNIN